MIIASSSFAHINRHINRQNMKLKSPFSQNIWDCLHWIRRSLSLSLSLFFFFTGRISTTSKIITFVKSTDSNIISML